MRPVNKGPAHLYNDGNHYGMARNGLISKLDIYCSYCERRIPSAIEVEHIQHKDHHSHLTNIWSNFLLSCKNCNTHKGIKNFPLSDWLIPDRDNTFIAFEYKLNGKVTVNPNLRGHLLQAAINTLSIFGLNAQIVDDEFALNNQVHIDRRQQRMQAWLLAKRYLKALSANPSPMLEDAVLDIAYLNGHFSIWMKAFENHAQFRLKLISKFRGTSSSCFNPVSSVAIGPHPNHDLLMHGGKI